MWEDLLLRIYHYILLLEVLSYQQRARKKQLAITFKDLSTFTPETVHFGLVGGSEWHFYCSRHLT